MSRTVQGLPAPIVLTLAILLPFCVLACARASDSAAALGPPPPDTSTTTPAVDTLPNLTGNWAGQPPDTASCIPWIGLILTQKSQQSSPALIIGTIWRVGCGTPGQSGAVPVVGRIGTNSIDTNLVALSADSGAVRTFIGHYNPQGGDLVGEVTIVDTLSNGILNPVQTPLFLLRGSPPP
jgi:hypothetical protein